MNEEGVESIESRVKDIVVEVLRVDRSRLAPTTHLMKDLDADSLDALDVALRIEKTFDIKVPDEAIKDFLTIGDIVRGIRAYRGVPGPTISG